MSFHPDLNQTIFDELHGIELSPGLRAPPACYKSDLAANVRVVELA